MKEALGSMLPNKTAFALLAALLRRTVHSGSLAVIDPWGERHLFGAGQGPYATVRINDPREPARLIANPGLRTGEAYMDGALTIEEGTLRDFLLIAAAVATELDKEERAFRRLIPAPLRRPHRANSIARAQANVAHHYDLSERLYRLFLDSDLQYSCAYFQDGAETLEQAQAKKKRHIASKLLLKPGMRVIFPRKSGRG